MSSGCAGLARPAQPTVCPREPAHALLVNTARQCNGGSPRHACTHVLLSARRRRPPARAGRGSSTCARRSRSGRTTTWRLTRCARRRSAWGASSAPRPTTGSWCLQARRAWVLRRRGNGGRAREGVCLGADGRPGKRVQLHRLLASLLPALAAAAGMASLPRPPLCAATTLARPQTSVTSGTTSATSCPPGSRST